MPNARQGSIHLFRVAEIDLYLHWSWFIVAVIEIGYMRGRYTSLSWSVLEYLSLFLIVLLHEFGHALACRQVGGTADQIMLWPLGGVAYVDPPPRPGAMLWSLVAGPLVNVILMPLLVAAYLAAQTMGWQQSMPNAYEWILAVLIIDAGLLAFNLLPIYPLDGGQILRSLLWFFLGRGRSLAVATAIGFIGGAGFVVFALWMRSVWLILISGYMLMNCWQGMKGAQALMRIEKLPRRNGFACPGCGSKPVLGARWRCSECGGLFDTFETGAVCPHCRVQHSDTMCIDCHKKWPMSAWAANGAIPGVTVIQGSSPVSQ
jgi:Zn-dependent protease